MKQTKQTKNKYLRQLVRNYEIELQRPKGLKYLDQFIKQLPETRYENLALFISKTIHNECKGITRYKGYNVISCNGIPKTQLILTNPSNLYFE